jgi:hypothetical protein
LWRFAVRKAGDRWRVQIPTVQWARVGNGRLAGLRRSFGGRPGLLPAETGLAAAGPLPDPAVDPQAGSLAILEAVLASMPGRTP